MQNHQRRALAEFDVVDQHAIGVNVAGLLLINSSGLLGKRFLNRDKQNRRYGDEAVTDEFSHGDNRTAPTREKPALFFAQYAAQGHMARLSALLLRAMLYPADKA
jgi:hypothetical protein